MRALVLTQPGGPEVLKVQERPDPAVGPGQVRIAVRAAGLNFADLLARVGLYPDAPKPPCVLGYEVAGTVESVGPGVEGHEPGERVVAVTRFNGQAELVTVAADAVWPLPDQVSFEEAAAVPVNYGTAYAGLVTMAGVKEGERVLVHSAGGGVGIAATQIARSRGAEVFGTASASKHDAIRAQGVDHPIDYRTADFAEEVLRLTNGEGVDVIMDALGPSSLRKGYRILRQGGRLIAYGASEINTGERRDLRAALKGLARMPFATMPWWSSLKIINENKGFFGLNLLHWWDREGSAARAVEPILGGLADGTFKPVVAETFPLEAGPDAHRFVADRKNVGKVVYVP